MPRNRSRRGARRANPMVPIRVDRLQAAQQLDGRPWPAIARALGTTHPRLFHLTQPGGPVQRKCRSTLREGFSKLLDVARAWLSGETESLQYVVSADAAIVDLNPGRNWVGARWSLWEGTPPHSPAIQLALDRLVAKADAALRRDLEAVPSEAYAEIPHADEFPADDVRAFGLLLVVQSVETGFELVRPLPPLDKAEALRLSGIQHMTMILKPWLDGTGPYPDWKRLFDQINDRYPPARDWSGLRVFMLPDRRDALFGTYDVLGRRWARQRLRRDRGARAV